MIGAFPDENVESRLEGVVEATRSLPSKGLDNVVHEPPRLAKEHGDSYCMELYAQLYRRTTRRGGVLYPYTGLQRARWRTNTAN